MTQFEEENRIPTEDSRNQTSQQATGPTKQLCRFYSQGRRCYYGKRCHFLHQKTAPSEAVGGLENRPNPKSECVDTESTADAHCPVPQQQSDVCGGCEKEHSLPSNPGATSAKQTRARKPCRYFMSGFCAMEDRCRFWHPQQFPPVEDQPVGPRESEIGGAHV